MLLCVTASGSDFRLTNCSSHYISNHTAFNIDCKICDRNFGIFKDVYKLCLEGSKENVEAFICYLKMEGLKVKY